MAKDDIRKFDFSQLIKGRTETEVITHDRSKVMSFPGAAFSTKYAHSDNTTKDTDEGWIQPQADNIYFFLGINLPDKAKILSVVVYGSAGAAAEQWKLVRIPIPYDGHAEMATANINTSSTTITDDTIDNNANCYALATSSLDTGDIIYSAKITMRLYN